MKIKIRLYISIILIGIILCTCHTNLYASERKHNYLYDIIEEYCDTINKKDIEGYIQLFSSDNCEKMNKYIELNGIEDFFHETEVEAIDNFVFDKELLFKCSIFSEYEFVDYEDYRAVYSYTKVYESDEWNDDYSIFIFVMEDGKWKIHRKIVPDIKALADCGVRFGTYEETRLLISQKEKMRVLADLSDSSTYSLKEVCPTSIRVCFTKQENISHYGKKVLLLNLRHI